MSEWTPVIVTIVLGLVGLAIQGFLLAYFVGRMREHQEGQGRLVDAFQTFTERALTALTDRMTVMDTFAQQTNSHRAELSARLGAVEASTEGLPRFREEFARQSATTIAHQTRIESDMERINRAVEGLQRQVANLAIHGGGATVMLPAARKSRAQPSERMDE